MSGGSYDYLCWHTDELLTRRGTVQAMADRLESTGYREAARATRNLMYLLDGVERAARALEDVWHAVEWADSGDYSEDQVRAAVEKFEPFPPSHLSQPEESS